ncbi:hypothetical protein SELMODRAFT_427988 [Selaginella moellendorffii]|uniref:Uncharacterized protein n=1 Tax=Selaginella moellendorffii TaxID=88036 RepID=D8T1C4_SELML|nr:hypothetical protein SELMODRAFT_427988 [Selaginella moellendorffii]
MRWQVDVRSIASASASIRQKSLHSWSFLVAANAQSGHISDTASKMALHSVYFITVMILGYCQTLSLSIHGLFLIICPPMPGSGMFATSSVWSTEMVKVRDDTRDSGAVSIDPGQELREWILHSEDGLGEGGLCVEVLLIEAIGKSHVHRDELEANVVAIIHRIVLALPGLLQGFVDAISVDDSEERKLAGEIDDWNDMSLC